MAIRLRGTHVPIPNTRVKPKTAEGTMLETAWESRWLPDYKKRKERFKQGRKTAPFASGFENAEKVKLPLKERVLFYCIKYKCFLMVDVMFKIKRLIGVGR